MRPLMPLTISALVLAGAVAPAAVQAQDDVPPVVAKFKEKDPGMEKIFADAVGYAVFPTVGKGGIGIGGARGKGWVYQGGAVVGRSTLTQVTIGLQLGGQAYSEIVFFQTRQALDNFKLGHLKLDAQASAVALTARASADLAYRKRVAGQKFSFTPVDKAK
jgi:lipid-binding SYLF domain-containing protein